MTQIQELIFNDFRQYQGLALRTEKPLPTRTDRLEHAGLGLFTEAGEIGTPIKRVAIYRKSLDELNKDGKTTLRQNIAEEIADAFWYLAIATDAIQGDLFVQLGDMMALRRDHVTSEQQMRRGALSLSSHVGRFNDTVLQLIKYPTTDSAETNKRLHTSIYYIAQCLLDIADAAGVNVLLALNDNVAKLRERFPDAYSDVAAEARADKGGLDARNS